MSATAEFRTVTLFPFGYTRDAGGVEGLGRLLTLDELEQQQTWRNLHPEFKRRVAAMMEAAAVEGVALGVGTGWRSFATQLAGFRRDPRGFAPPGNSNHEGFPANGNGDRDAVAADMVPRTAWTWMEANCGRFGLRTFRHVNNEPWHIQPVEIPASRRRRTVRWELPGWPLPMDPRLPAPEPTPPPPVIEPTPPPVIEPTTPPVVEPPSPSAAPHERIFLPVNKTVLHPDSRDQLRGNGDVVLLQVLALGMYTASRNETFDVGPLDGDYGPRTQAAARLMQALNGLETDGIVGPRSWAAFLNADGS